MSAPSDKIANQTKNCSFSLQSIEQLLVLMATQQKEYSDIGYKANGPFTLVLKAKKNGIAEEVALKVLECTDQTNCQIQAMEREYAIQKQLPSSDYFMVIQDQFFLTEMDDSAEQGKSENSNTARKIYFVQQMEMCQGSLHDTIQQYSELNKDPPTENYKELLAIQMLDSVNLLHQKYIGHGNITTQHFLVSKSYDYPVILKLYNLQFNSHFNPINTENSVSNNQSKNLTHPMGQIQGDCLKQDLVCLGKVLLQLDNIGTNFDYSIISNNTLTQSDLTTMFETKQLNQSTLLYKIACSLLSKSRENNQNARSMLLLLLQKHTGVLNIPLFSVVLKSHVYSLSLPISCKRIILDSLLWQVSRQHKKINTIDSWFNSKGQRKTSLTVDLLKSALSIMLEWKEFSEVYDVLGVGVGGVVFGVENLVKKRKSALKLSLCTNKAEIIREIGIMRICQDPYIVQFYSYKFFKDANGNEFVVYELERCKYSLIQHMELQRIYGKYSDEQKNRLILQIIDSVGFLHENRVLHRNIKLDSFLITENGSGQAVVKLGNFSHAVQLQDNFKELAALENQLFKHEYQSPVNCILQRHNRESPLYFAPERWDNPDLSTYQTDSFSVGLCIFLLGNQLVCSEEQLARKLLSVPIGSTGICLYQNPQINTKSDFKSIAKQLLMFQPQQRKSVKNLAENFTTSKENKGNSKGLDENNFQQQMMLTIEDNKVLDDFKKAPMRFASLYSLYLNLNKISIEETESTSLLHQICNLHNLSRISFNFIRSSMISFGAQSQSPLSPLARLVNLFSVQLNLNENLIRDVEAQFLLSPLANLLNLSSLTLTLEDNRIGDIGAQSLLSPLANLLNLSNLALNLHSNLIEHQGAQSLLSPLANVLNLSSLILTLENNRIGDIGAQSLLSPLANLLNLSSLALNLNSNQIGDIGAQSLLSPLANFLNLSSLTLTLEDNTIGQIGAQSLLSPLANVLNLSSLTLSLYNNQIGHIGAQSLLTPLANLLNLSNLTLTLEDNRIKDIGAQSLLSPLANLLNLSSLNLCLYNNLIRDIGAQSLLSPLENLLNLSNLTLTLENNRIGDIGAQSMLSSLENLLNLSSLTLNLNSNQIGHIGAQSLLSPLMNLLNLQSLTLSLYNNRIRDKGAQSLLSPLAYVLNLSSLTLVLENNRIGDIGAKSLLSPLANLLNLSTLFLNLGHNQICDIGAYSLFYPLSNLISLSSLDMQLNNNLKTKQTEHLFNHYFNKIKALRVV